MPLLHRDQRSEGWLSARRGRITASVAAACLGLDPHMSRAAAWRKIVGATDVGSGENRHTRWGVEFEPKARQDYEAESGYLVHETGFWVHPVYDFLGASPDGLVSTDGVVEVKCPGTLPTSVPLAHRIQMLIQMACTERTWGHYYCWTHNGTFLRRVDAAGISGLIRRLEAFHREFVLTNTEPPRKQRRKKR